MVDARDLVVFASDAAFAVDENSRVVAWNSCAQDFLGYAPGHIPLAVHEAIRARFPTIVPQCPPPSSNAIMQRALPLPRREQ